MDVLHELALNGGRIESMTKTHVLALLKENQNERGIAHWKKMEARKTGKLKSFGLVRGCKIS